MNAGNDQGMKAKKSLNRLRNLGVSWSSPAPFLLQVHAIPSILHQHSKQRLRGVRRSD